jgi:flagellar protein FliS
MSESGRHVNLGIDGAPDSAIAPADGSPALRSYQESQILTASREQLLLLTHDGVLRFLARARRGLERSDYHEKHVGLSRAQALIVELRRTLDFDAAPELAENLARIYGFLLEELARADASDDGARIARVMELVAELRATWAEALTR